MRAVFVRVDTSTPAPTGVDVGVRVVSVDVHERAIESPQTTGSQSCPAGAFERSGPGECRHLPGRRLGVGPSGPRLVSMSQDAQRNQVVCGECGEIRLETPPGTSILPTLGMAKKAAGTAGACDCGRRPEERPGVVSPEDSGGGESEEHAEEG